MYMAIDQFGETYHGLKHPRKDLMEQLGATKAERIYVDAKNGDILHVGYVIAGHWCRIFKVEPLRKKVGKNNVMTE